MCQVFAWGRVNSYNFQGLPTAFRATLTIGQKMITVRKMAADLSQETESLHGASLNYE
jgi:hypothetical protein